MEHIDGDTESDSDRTMHEGYQMRHPRELGYCLLLKFTLTLVYTHPQCITILWFSLRQKNGGRAASSLCIYVIDGTTPTVSPKPTYAHTATAAQSDHTALQLVILELYFYWGNAPMSV